MFGIAIGTGYVLIVTFAPAAYAATLISTLTACLGWAWAARHRRSETASALALSALLLPLTIGGIVVAAVSGGFMTEQLRTVASDLADREGNWSGGLALPDSSPATALFGMGLGTYPRIVLARKQA